MDVDLRIKHHFLSGVYIKEMHLPAGHYADTHQHAYDHFSVLAKGIATVEIDGQRTRHEGPAIIEIEAGKTHRIEALTDTEWYCIHGTSETDPAKVDHVLIKEVKSCHG